MAVVQVLIGSVLTTAAFFSYMSTFLNSFYNFFGFGLGLVFSFGVYGLHHLTRTMCLSKRITLVT